MNRRRRGVGILAWVVTYFAVSLSLQAIFIQSDESGLEYWASLIATAVIGWIIANAVQDIVEGDDR